MKLYFKIIPIVLCYFSLINVEAQYKITIEAYLLDRDTNQPISYANIGFVNKGVGTVSDQDGLFYLSFDEEQVSKNDVFRVSHLGYQTKELTFEQIDKILKKDNKLYIKRSTNTLETPTIFSDNNNNNNIVLGENNDSQEFMGYWKEQKALGSEIAKLIRNKKENLKLHNLSVNITENNADSLLIRVNIYEEKNKKPGKKIITSNIYHTITKNKGVETIDLSPYHISMNNDFIIGIELIKVYGDTIALSIGGSTGGRTFLRYLSQDQWIVHKDVDMDITVQASYPENKAIPKERKEPAEIILYWDTSLSMNDRNIEKEMLFLNKYLYMIKDTRIQLRTFSHKSVNKKIYNIKNGVSKMLEEDLKALTYHGGTSFSDLFIKDTIPPDAYFVFTDGKHTYGSINFADETPIFFFNTLEKAAHGAMQNTSKNSNGHYSNLFDISVDEAIQNVSKEQTDSNLYHQKVSDQQVKGIVFSSDKPVQGCKVAVKGSLEQVYTNSEGHFTINADPNQTLNFDFLGMKPQRKKILDTTNLKINLIPKHTVLEEVSLVEKKEKQSKEIINIGSKVIDKTKLGFAAYTLEKEEFPASAIYLYHLIRGQFPGVRVTATGFGNEAVYSVRGGNSINFPSSPLFVVDGTDSNVPPHYLQPSQIERITLISGLAGTIRYGSRGRGGVFIITTKVGDFNDSSRIKNSLLVTDNDYNESPILSDPNQNRPPYLDPLWKSVTQKDATSIYYELRKKHQLNIPFYIYSASYFERWDSNFSEEILSNIAEIGYNNYDVLRTLAFQLEALKKIEKAQIIYQRIFDLYPNYAQSHLDLARITMENQQYQKAFDMYKTILSNNQESVEFSGVLSQAEFQMKYLLTHYRYAVPYQDMPKHLLIPEETPTKIVFDWNSPQVEFELQFVGPNNKFYNWVHRYDENKEFISNEIAQGYSSKEFEIDHNTSGKWIINLKSHNTESSHNPAFLKYTVYKNPGSVKESKEVKFIKLYNHTKKATLDIVMSD